MTIEEKIEEFIENIRKENYDILGYIYNNKNSDKIYYSSPYWDNKEIIAAIKSLLVGKWISSGEDVKKFERKFAKKINEKFGLMVNSGSSANLLMIASLKKILKWEDDSEIIVSPVAFPTTISVIPQNRLKPVFVDIEMQTLNIDINLIEEKITSKTKAIFLSPVLGNTPDLDGILEICKKYNLKLILDGCDSLGSKWKGKYLNEYATATSDSLYASHHICTGQGGLITSNNEEIITYARSLATWSRDCYCQGAENLLPNGMCKLRFSNWLKDDGYDGIIDHKYCFTGELGYNLNPLDLQGSIGLVQLEKLDEIMEKRKLNKKIIQQIFEEELGDYLYIPNELENAETSWFGMPIVMKDYIFDGAGMISAKDNKRSLVYYMEKNFLQTRQYFSGNLLVHRGYKHLDDYKKYPNANLVLDNVFFIGNHPSYTEKTFERIREILQNWKKING